MQWCYLWPHLDTARLQDRSASPLLAPAVSILSESLVIKELPALLRDSGLKSFSPSQLKFVLQAGTVIQLHNDYTTETVHPQPE